jgi:hypothetical protein
VIWKAEKQGAIHIHPEDGNYNVFRNLQKLTSLFAQKPKVHIILSNVCVLATVATGRLASLFAQPFAC